MPDATRDALLAALLDCVAALDLSDDELVDPGFASDVLGDVTGHLGGRVFGGGQGGPRVGRSAQRTGRCSSP